MFEWLKKSWSRKDKLPNDSIGEKPLSLQDEYNRLRLPQNRRSACYAPSVNMLFATDGTVKACCHNHENSLGKYPEQSIAEIWNSREAALFRKKMEEYQFLSGCGQCTFDFQSRNFDQMFARDFDALPRNKNFPSMMEFLLSNTCNLECVMCSGELSSSIRTNRDKLPPIKSPYDEKFIEQLQEFIPHLKETRFSGAGEAFSIHVNYRIWNMLIEKNPECLIVVQTNGTILNAKVKDYLARGNFEVGVSLDSLQAATYENIRLNASFEQVMTNIQFFSEYSKARNKPFTISTCIMRSNWQELPDFLTFCNRIGAYLTLHKVWSPLSYSLHNLSSKELEKIHDALRGFTFRPSNKLETRNYGHYKYFVSVIAQWAKAAKEKESCAVDFSHKTNAELLNVVKSNIADYLLNQPMIEDDPEALLNTCLDKLETVLASWTNEEEKRTLLLKLCETLPAEMIPALKNRPVEKLFEMSKVN